MNNKPIIEFGFRRISIILQISEERSLHCLGYPRFGNIFALFGVSEIRKHRCTLWGCTKFGNFSFHSLGVSKFRVKPLICPQQFLASE